MPEYAAADYIHHEPRPDEDTANCLTCTDLYGDVCATVTWTPRDGGEPVTVTGPYLDGHRQSGEIVLSCGIEEMLTDLDLWPVIEGNDEKRWTICDLVNQQLRHRPAAVLTCPEGRATLELLRHG